MKRLFCLFTILIMGLTSSSLHAQWVQQINPLGSGDSAMIGKVQFVSPTEGWISGSRGDFLHTTNAGANWLVITPFPDDTIWSPSDAALSMSWVNQTHGWKINSIGPTFGTSYGVVIHQTSDGGNTWQKKVLSTTEGDFAVQIQFVDVNNGWLLIFNFSTQSAKFLRTTDGGNNWNPFTGAGIFFFVDANNGWSFYGSGTNGSEPPYKILRTTDGGTGWIEQFSDNITGGYNAMYFSDLNNGWIVGDSGKVLHTTNGGTNWNYVTNTGINPNDRSKTVFFLDANTGWISTKNEVGDGIIQHTTDAGANWTAQGTPLVNPLGGNAIFSIYFVDAQNGWLTADYGKICRYTGTTGVEDINNSPNDFSLMQNYPNPFNPSTSISFIIPSKSFVSLKVFDLLGRELATLLANDLPAGRYTQQWNAEALPSGVYMYRLQAGSFNETKKLILLR
ncbi:MAG: T9SS type A sorting domain-containing protein [Ignavibacteriales bacterium]|nr:T9SS type A sorting domain-containing protein [Ignavibacteriales bacterium]